MKIAIVIPAFNEEENISEVVKSLRNYGCKLIVVNDGSTDKTTNVLSKFGRSNRLKIITHKVNLGKGAAMKAGADYAFKNGFEAVIFIDSDGQHFADDLPRFVDSLKKGFDFVMGSRNLNMGIPLFRFLGNKFASIMVNYLFGIYASDLLCGYRAMTKKAYQKLRWESSRYGVETEMVIRAAKSKIRFCEIPVSTFYYDKTRNLRIRHGDKLSLHDAFEIFVSIFRWKFFM